jgi:hypothetical protein
MDGKDMYNNSDQQPELADSVTKSNMLDEETTANGDILKQHQYLDACLGVQDGTAASSSRAQSSTAQAVGAGKGKESKDKRPASAENRREAAEKRARQDRLVLGITDYFAVQR